jgi:hypothetical protein
MTINPSEVNLARPFLQNVSIAYRNTGYIGDFVFPIVPGLNRQAKVIKDKVGQWIRDRAEPRARGTAAARSHPFKEAQNLDPINYAASTGVPREDIQDQRAMGNAPLDCEIEAVEYVSDAIALRREIEVSGIVKTTDWNGVGAGGEDAAGLWAATDSTNTMIADLAKADLAITRKSLNKPNKLVMDYYTWNNIRGNEYWLGKLNLTQFQQLTIPLLSQFLGYDILVGSAVNNTAVPDDDGGDFIGTFCWELNAAKGFAFLCHAPNRPSKRQVTAGYQYRLQFESTGVDAEVTTWYDNDTKSYIYQADQEFDITAVDTNAGYAFKDTILT